LIAAGLGAAVAGAAARAQCGPYQITAGPAGYELGLTDIADHASEDGLTTIALPFPVQLGGVSYTSATVSENGFIEFGGAMQSSSNTLLPTSQVQGTAIFAYWCDLSVTESSIGNGIFTATSGDPGNQDFVVEWRATSVGYESGRVYFEIVFHENQNYFDMLYFLTPDWSHATVGFQTNGAAAVYESFPGTKQRGASTLPGYGESSLRVTCGPTAGACCNSARACMLAFSADSCLGASQFVPSATCSPSPCPVPANDTCAGATDLAALGFPAEIFIDNAPATDDATDCGTSTRGVWFTYTATQDCVLHCSSVGAAHATWASAPDCSSSAHCLGSGSSNVAIPLAAGQSVYVLAGSASSGPSFPAPLVLSFNVRPVVAGEGGSITPINAPYQLGSADTGNHADNMMSVVPLPFPITIFGHQYTTANVSSNGFIEFASNAQSYNFPHDCLPTNDLGETIMVYWDDLDTGFGPGKGVFTSASGPAGGRDFVIEWRASLRSDFPGFTMVPPIRFEAIFHENQPYFDCVYDAVPTFSTAVVGVQAGPSGWTALYECLSGDVPGISDLGSGLSLRVSTVAAGACCGAYGACTVRASAADCPAGAAFFNGPCSTAPCPLDNDLCVNATNLNDHLTAAPFQPALSNLITPYRETVYVYGAGDDGASCPIHHGVWYTFIAPTPSVLLCNETGPQTAVWATTSDCNGSRSCQSGQAGIQVPLDAGETVKLLVGTDSAAIDANAPLGLAFSLLPDECAAAIPIAPGNSFDGALFNATPTAGGATDACQFPTQRDLWYTFHAAVPGEYTIAATPVGVDLDAPIAIDVFQGCGGPHAGCALGTDGAAATLDASLAPGTYVLRIASDNPAAAYTLSISQPECAVDFNRDGQVGVQDIFDFLNAWFANDPSADFNGVDGVSVQDIFDYLNAWFVGC
jgi:hypothetical protein